MRHLLNLFVRAYFPEIARVVLLGVAAAGLQISCMVLVIDFVTVFLGFDPQVELVGQWYADDPRAFLVQAPVAIFVGLLAAALISYLARTVNVRTMVKHEKRCITEIVSALGTAEDLGTSTTQEVLRTITRDARYYGRLVDGFLEVCLPLVFFVSVVVFLLWISPVVTVVILSIVLAFLLVFYLASRRVASLGLALETHAPADVAARKGAIEAALSLEPNEASPGAVSVAEHPDVGRFLDVYAARLRISFKAFLISGVFLAFLVPAVLLYLGSELVDDKNAISDVLIYVVCLNYSLLQVRTFSTLLAKIRVFQPFATRFVALHNTLTNQPSEPEPTDSAAIDLRGSAFGVIHAGTLNKMSIANIYHALKLPLRLATDTQVIWRDLSAQPIERTQTLVDFYFRRRAEIEALECEHLQSLLEEALVERGLQKSHTSVSEPLHRRGSFILQLYHAALERRPKAVLIDGRGLRGIRSPGYTEIRRLLSDTVTILYFHEAPPKPVLGVSHYQQVTKPAAAALAADETLEEFAT